MVDSVVAVLGDSSKSAFCRDNAAHALMNMSSRKIVDALIAALDVPGLDRDPGNGGVRECLYYLTGRALSPKASAADWGLWWKQRRDSYPVNPKVLRKEEFMPPPP
jgi:hypothetical protein